MPEQLSPLGHSLLANLSSRPSGEQHTSLAELLSALSFALDLVEDAKPGHAIRTCLLGMRIAYCLQLGVPESADLYYALLLKDVGCSSNARILCDMVGGDDRIIKREAKLEDWTRMSFASVRLLWRNAPTAAGVVEKLRRIIDMGLHQNRYQAEVIGLRCDRGSHIVRKMGLSRRTAEAIRSLDEHWDGSGYPDRLVGNSIPLLARILNVAQHLDHFAMELSRSDATAVMVARSGRWFDPEIVRVVKTLEAQGLLWDNHGSALQRELVHTLEPGYALNADDRQIDNISEAFADIIDAKSSFTYTHSVGVTKAALGIADELGFSAQRRTTIYRAALLHDLGKLRVSNTILDKQAKPDEREWFIIREHPGLSRQVLERIGVFDKVAEIAGNHHEKLDGSGYPHGIKGDQLSIESRLVTVADIYGALSENRPYRAGMEHAQIRKILLSDTPHKIDADCVEALLRFTEREQSTTVLN